MAESTSEASEQVHGRVKHTSSDNKCEPCKVDNTFLQATGWCGDCDEMLCDNCYKTHRNQKMSRDHQLWSITEMVARKQRPRVSNKCDKHGRKMLEYFCDDHRELGCGQCFVATHRACKKVICISEFKTIGSEEFKSLEELLGTLDSRLHAIQETARRNKELTTKQHDKAIADIEEAGEKLKSWIDQLVKKQVETVEKTMEEDMRNMTHIEETSEDVADKINTNREMLTVERTNNNQLFITMIHVQRETKMLETKVSQTEQVNKVTEKMFVLNPDLAAVLEVTKLGSLNDKTNMELDKATDEVVEVMVVKRFRKMSTWQFKDNTGAPDAIHVSTNKDVRLLYVLVYPCELGDSDIELSVYEFGTCLSRSNTLHKKGASDVIDVKVVTEGDVHGVTLLVNRHYHIVVTIKGNYSYAGIEGQYEVTVGGVKFSFSHSSHSRGRTSVRTGQIAGLKFTCI